MNVKYDSGALLITFPCVDPVAAHSQLISSILFLIRHSTSMPNKPKAFGDEVMPLFDLLEILSPREKDLEKLY